MCFSAGLCFNVTFIQFRLTVAFFNQTYKYTCTSKPLNHKKKSEKCHILFRRRNKSALWEGWTELCLLVGIIQTGFETTHGPVHCRSRSGLQRNKNRGIKVQNTSAFQSLTYIIRLQELTCQWLQRASWKDSIFELKRRTKAPHFESVRH